jgi:subtilisin family serine protease
MPHVHKQLGVTVERHFKGLEGLYLVKLPKGLSVAEAVVQYSNDSNILYAEPNYIYRVQGQAVFPDDEFFYNLWGMYNTGQSSGTPGADISATGAWGITTGSAEVIIAVLDTGVDYNHPDLAGNIWRNPGESSDGADTDGNGFIDDLRGWDFVDNNNRPMDEDGHGTHVAGIIAALGNNQIGVTGVVWQAKIMPLRMIGPEGGTTADAIDAINYAGANGAHIINSSWGGSNYSQALKDAIAASPAIVICAAGNEKSSNDSVPMYPASYDAANIIAVAATDRQDKLASFSNYGADTVHLGAPGVEIYSTLPQGAYGNKSGTSMATPYVAGVAGLIKSLRPEFTTLQIKETILDTVDQKSSLTGKVLTGGRLNAQAALQQVYIPAEVNGPIIYGDINGDGNVNAGDVILILRYIVGLKTLNEQQLSAADVSGSGVVGTEDVVLLLRYIVGLTETFPVHNSPN